MLQFSSVSFFFEFNDWLNHGVNGSGDIKIWSIFDKNPPFTDQQLQALVIEEEFEIIDWPRVFSIEFTPFFEAATETFTHPVYSKIEMDF